MVCVVYTREHIEAEKNGWHFADDNLKFIFLNEIIAFWFKFHWSLFHGAQLTINRQWYKEWFDANGWQAIVWTSDVLVYWRTYWPYSDLRSEQKRRFLLTISRLMHIHHERKLPVVSSFKLNTSRPKQNGRHFADNIFKFIFKNENVWMTLKIS